MSDAAFKTAPFASYTTEELVRGSTAGKIRTETRIRMLDEISRREKVEAGDVSVMTPGERLRHAKATT